MVCERREASACLIMLNAKQGSHWYHFYNVFGMTRPGIDPTPILTYDTRSGRSATWASITIKDTVICKKADCEIYVVWKVIDKYQDEDGPNTEPWGTPVNTGARFEQTTSMTTFYVRPGSQAVIHWRISFRIPYTLVFYVAPYRKPWQSP